MTTLYKKDKKGILRSWEVVVNNYNELIKRSGKVGGKIQQHVEDVELNTLRDPHEQALSKMDSAIRKHLKQGYFYTEEDAMAADSSKNQLGFQKPMKAIVLNENVFVNPAKCSIQYKYNGHRCLVTNQNGKNIAYSNSGELIETVPEIIHQMKIPENETIDGELYCHGVPLQTISSWVRRKQDNTDKLEFVAFDLVSKDRFVNRLSALRRLYLGNRVRIAGSVTYSGRLIDDMNLALEDGYEGLILRPDGYGYEGFKTKGLIKLKPRFDDEYCVVSIGSSKDGWAILECITKKGQLFTVSAPGTMIEKKAILNAKDYYIGKYVTIAFPEYTIDGLPSQPVALHWRNIPGG